MLLKQACLFGINYAIWMQLKCPYIGMTIVLIYEWLIATPCNDGQLKYPFESLVKKIINLIESRLLLPEELFQIVFFCRVFFSAAGYLFIGSFDFCLCRQMFGLPSIVARAYAAIHLRVSGGSRPVVRNWGAH